MFALIRGVMSPDYRPKHLLWTLCFLLTCDCERRLALFLGTNRNTLRKFTWPTIVAISKLSETVVSCHVVCLICSISSRFLTFSKINFNKRFIGDNGRACKVSVDGTDFWTVEWTPFNSAGSHTSSLGLVLDMKCVSPLPLATLCTSVVHLCVESFQILGQLAFGCTEPCQLVNFVWQMVATSAPVVPVC